MTVEIHDEFSMNKIADAEIIDLNVKPARSVVEVKIAESYSSDFSIGQSALFTLRKDGIFRQKGGGNLRIDALDIESERLLAQGREGKKIVTDYGLPIKEAKKDFENRKKAVDFLHTYDYQHTSLKKSTRYVAIDVETTGLYPDSGDKILQFALFDVTELVLKGKQNNFRGLSSFVNPERSIPPEATKIHGITNDIVLDQAPFIEHADKITDFIGDAVLVGHNVEFDMKFINYQLIRLGKSPIENQLVCTWKIAKDALLIENGFVPNNKLTTLSAKFINRNQQELIRSSFGGADHDARYDAIMSAILAHAFFKSGLSKSQIVRKSELLSQNDALIEEQSSSSWQKLAYVGLTIAGLFGVALMV